MSEIIEAWSKDKRRVKELENEYSMLLARCRELELEVSRLHEEKDDNVHLNYVNKHIRKKC